MRIERVVVNSSPLIVLFRSGQSDLLPSLFNSVIVPEQVYGEIVAGKIDDAAKTFLSKASWIERRSVEITLPIAAWNLGEGESAVFSFALREQGYRAVVDDLAARRCARVFGIPTLGTGALLILAKRRGLIHSVEERLRWLRKSGMYLSDTVFQELMAQAGE